MLRSTSSKKRTVAPLPDEMRSRPPRRALFVAGFADPHGQRYLHSIHDDDEASKKRIADLERRFQVQGVDCHDRLLKDQEYRSEPGFVRS